MKSFKIVGLIACILMISLFAGNAFAAKKAVVIAGVSEAGVKTVGSYLLIFEGIKEGLATAGIEPEFQYVELDSLKSEEELQAAGEKAVANVLAAKPDVVITLNDNCLKYVGSKIDSVPVVFAWVFDKPQALGMPKDNVTGVLRRSYAADIWGMAHKLIGAKTVSLMSKYSTSMAGVRKYLAAGADKLEAASGVRYKEMHLINTFEEWQSTIENFTEDFIYLADTSRIAKGDTVLSRVELSRWTVDNAKVPVIAATEVDVKGGALYAIVTSENGIGMTAAEVALKILNGTAPKDIPYVKSNKGKLVINVKTAEKYKVEIPYDILSTAGAIYEE